MQWRNLPYKYIQIAFLDRTRVNLELTKENKYFFVGYRVDGRGRRQSSQTQVLEKDTILWFLPFEPRKPKTRRQ